MSLLSIVRVGVSFCRTAFLASVRVHYMILGCFISSWFFLVSSGVRARVSVCVHVLECESALLSWTRWDDSRRGCGGAWRMDW